MQRRSVRLAKHKIIRSDMRRAFPLLHVPALGFVEKFVAAPAKEFAKKVMHRGEQVHARQTLRSILRRDIRLVAT